ncbi:hypothetical protein PV08_04302 [Exophiala spinifera]|uniref:RBR-type E3 ubiquitin transferase n=1 Tax=Exophiala spinifera TaxID=91928 RepID=A0A0D1YPJ2_9EURO|nr:uncharacterized protein PV08_04302 [Exophiala spinifera]KIW17111.1 hypothetical protein PV08_04302 [Exophiala spinifera]
MASEQEGPLTNLDPNRMASDQEQEPLNTSSTGTSSDSMVSGETDRLTEPIDQELPWDQVLQSTEPGIRETASESMNTLQESGYQTTTTDQESNPTDQGTNSVASDQTSHDHDHPRDPSLSPLPVVLFHLESETLSHEDAQNLIDFANGLVSDVTISGVGVSIRHTQSPMARASSGPRFDRTSFGYEAYSQRYLQDVTRVDPIKTEDDDECIICHRDVSEVRLHLLSCGHRSCRTCLNQLVSISTQDMGSFPPRCCFSAIDVEEYEYLLDDNVIEHFNRVVEEFSDQSRFFCSNMRCSAYINTGRLQLAQGKFVTCHKCGLETCKECRRGADAHQCPPPEEPMDPASRELFRQRGYKRCPACGIYCERAGGCPMLRCRCGQSFCFSCGRPSRTGDSCNCFPLETWDAPHMTLTSRDPFGPRRVEGRANLGAMPHWYPALYQPSMTTVAEERTSVPQHEQRQFQAQPPPTQPTLSVDIMNQPVSNAVRYYPGHTGVSLPPSRPVHPSGPPMAERQPPVPNREFGSVGVRHQNSARSIPEDVREAERHVQRWEESFFEPEARQGAPTTTRQQARNQHLPGTTYAAPMLPHPHVLPLPIRLPQPGFPTFQPDNAFLNPRRAPQPPRGNSRADRPREDQDTNVSPQNFNSGR